MKKLILIAIMVTVLGMATLAQATLSVIGSASYDGAVRNLIYDTDLNITWLDYVHGPRQLADQRDWAESLFGYSGWKVPSANQLQALNGKIELFNSLNLSYPDYYNRYYWSSDAAWWSNVFHLAVDLQNLDIWEMRDNNSVSGLAVHSGQVSGAPVPVPATILLLGFGLAGLAGIRRRLG